ncbi:hypothetical protein J5N97_026004 [Dioscorea zingiberensis]|uniref:Receptor-like serine/threonine-protein kinase n=1 Tax=Dioscorea zingiberensis TaxID=325984 RepID=A0A9D5C1B3_9LILI|nr:hypothetical protein J5N97_026004 [Dioscorea zingiberensis]
MVSALQLLLCFLTITSCPSTVRPQTSDGYPSLAAPATQWLNVGPSAPFYENKYIDGSLVRPILVDGWFAYGESEGFGFACGFVCRGQPECHSFTFAVFIIKVLSLKAYIELPKQETVHVVWTANRDKTVKEGAMLELTHDGDLVLTDVDESIVWSSGTAGKSVARMELCSNGSLGLFDSSGVAIWESFDHPTDTLLLGQRLAERQKLTASVSPSNWSEGLFHMGFDDNGIQAYVQTDVLYYLRGSMHILSGDTSLDQQLSYLEFVNGSLVLIFSPLSIARTPLPLSQYPQFLRLDSDGHFRAYQFDRVKKWNVVTDLLSDSLEECDYPTACGRYGICLNGQCSCPHGDDGETSYFTALDGDPKHGCSMVTPLTCQESQHHHFVPLSNVSYFNLRRPTLSGVDADTCKVVCMTNCSCKAAFLQYHSNASDGRCYLLYDVYSLIRGQKSTIYNSTAFLKVQLPARSSSKKKVRLTLMLVLGSVAVAVAMFIILINIICVRTLLSKKKSPRSVVADMEDVEENHIYHVLEIPARFSYNDLVSATNNFSRELGTGGSGSVFEGTLRKNLDFRRPTEEIYLLKVLQEKAKENCLHDVILKYNKDMDMELQMEEAVKMIRIAMWCLQADFKSRPAMSIVVKVLEDTIDFEPIVDLDFLMPSTMAFVGQISNLIFNSLPSGPR